MAPDSKPSLSPGVQPYDRLLGARVGALAGGVLGVIPAALMWPAFGWVVAGAVLGGIAGYLWQVREGHGHPSWRRRSSICDDRVSEADGGE